MPTQQKLSKQDIQNDYLRNIQSNQEVNQWNPKFFGSVLESYSEMQGSSQQSGGTQGGGSGMRQNVGQVFATQTTDGFRLEFEPRQGGQNVQLELPRNR